MFSPQMWSKCTGKIVCSMQLSAYYSSNSLKQSSPENKKDNTTDNITIWAHNLTRYPSGYFQMRLRTPHVFWNQFQLLWRINSASYVTVDTSSIRGDVTPPSPSSFLTRGREDRQHMVGRVRLQWPQGTQSLPLEVARRVSQKLTRASLSSTAQSPTLKSNAKNTTFTAKWKHLTSYSTHVNIIVKHDCSSNLNHLYFLLQNAWYQLLKYQQGKYFE